MEGRNGMNITKDENLITLRCDDDLVGGHNVDFRRELKALLENHDLDVMVDFTLVEMIDSTGIGTLIAAQNRLKKKGRKLTVGNVSDDIFNMFEIMRLNKHFNVERPDHE